MRNVKFIYFFLSNWNAWGTRVSHQLLWKKKSSWYYFEFYFRESGLAESWMERSMRGLATVSHLNLFTFIFIIILLLLLLCFFFVFCFFFFFTLSTNLKPFLLGRPAKRRKSGELRLERVSFSTWIFRSRVFPRFFFSVGAYYTINDLVCLEATEPKKPPPYWSNESSALMASV